MSNTLIPQSVTGNVVAGTTITLTLPQNVNAGSSIAVVVGQASASNVLTGITDNQGNTYTSGSLTGASNATTMTIAGRVAKNVIGGPTIITVTLTSTTAVAIAFELAGLDTITSVDGSANATGTGTAATAGTVVTKNPNDIQICSVMNVTNATYTLGANQFNLIQISDGTNSLGVSSRHVGNAGNQSLAMTLSSSVTWLGLQNCLFSSNLNTNNFQFMKAHDNGNGVLSFTERIR